MSADRESPDSPTDNPLAEMAAAFAASAAAAAEGMSRCHLFPLDRIPRHTRWLMRRSLSVQVGLRRHPTSIWTIHRRSKPCLHG